MTDNGNFMFVPGGGLLVPKSGMVCPTCGEEKDRLLDGNLNRTVVISHDDGTRYEPRCKACWDAWYVAHCLPLLLDGVPALVTREEYERQVCAEHLDDLREPLDDENPNALSPSARADIDACDEFD